MPVDIIAVGAVEGEEDGMTTREGVAPDQFPATSTTSYSNILQLEFNAVCVENVRELQNCVEFLKNFTE